MNTILLQPTDVLFFKDGRPMEGSLSGHTAAWPLPDVTNHALHAALHRSGFGETSHKHKRGRSGSYSETRDRLFGSLVTAGPFPVEKSAQDDTWFFPRPGDAQDADSLTVTHLPVFAVGQDDDPWIGSSLPGPLEYAVASTAVASKASLKKWISKDSFENYLRGSSDTGSCLDDSDIADRESQIGIAIDPETQTTGTGEAEGKIYSAQYLRLRENIRLGVAAVADDKLNGNPDQTQDLIKLLLDQKHKIVIGGQQRTCTAERDPLDSASLPFPLGFTNENNFDALPNGKFAVKWVLLSPAIWPHLQGTHSHPGGWLPSWIEPEKGRVMLKDKTHAIKRSERKRTLTSLADISAQLVAAIIPKPIPVTGWALPNGVDREEGGAKPILLAVPAGAVYYFEADTPAAAVQLANALNWHGTSSGSKILNRRSNLMGEKGYGLGVCGTWQFFGDVSGRPNNSQNR